MYIGVVESNLPRVLRICNGFITICYLFKFELFLNEVATCTQHTDLYIPVYFK